MVAFNQTKRFEIDWQEDELLDSLQDRIDELEFAAEFDSQQYVRDLTFWSALSLAIGVFIGMAIGVMR